MWLWCLEVKQTLTFSSKQTEEDEKMKLDFISDFKIMTSTEYLCCHQVLLNLANQYENNEMYPEALNSYQVIVKNKMFSNAGQ